MLKCRFPRCRQEADLTYIDKPLCNDHWQRLTDPDLDTIGEAGELALLGLRRNADGEVVEDDK